MSKKLSTIIIAVIGIFAMLSVAAASFFSSSAFTEGMGDKVAQIATDTLESKVEIGQVAVESARSVGVKDITVYDKTGGEIAQVNYVRVDFSVLGFLEPNPLDGVSNINVSGVKANIIQREDGSFNFMDLISSEKSEKNYHGKVHVQDAEAKVVFDGKEALLEKLKADLDFAHYPAIHLEGEGFNQGAEINISGNVSDEKTTASINVKNIAVENYLQYVPAGIIPADTVKDIKGKVPEAEISLVKIGEDIYYTGQAELTDGEVIILDKKVEKINGLFSVDEHKALVFARASCDGQEASAHGRVLLDTGTPVLDMAIEANDFNPAKIIDNKDFSAKVNAIAHVTGPVDNPVVDGKVKITDGEAAGYKFTDLSAEVHYADNKVFAKNIAIDALDGHIAGEAEFNAKDLSYVAHVKVNNLETGYLQQDGIPLSGTVSGDLALDGVSDNLDTMNIYGSIFSEGLTVYGAGNGGQRLHVNSVHSSFAKLGKNLNIDFLSAEFENGGILGLRGEVALNESVNLTFYGSNLDMSKFITSEENRDNKLLSGRIDVRGTAVGPINNPIIRSDFTAIHGTLGYQPFNHLRGSVAGSLRGLKISNFVMEHGSTTWTMEGQAGFRDAKGSILENDLMDMGVNLQVKTEGARMENLIKPFIPEIDLTGNVENEISISGSLRNPYVKGKINFYEGSINGLFLQYMNGEYTVKNHVLTLNDFHVETSWIDMDLNGTVSDIQNVPIFDLKVNTNDVLLNDFADDLPYPVTGHARFDGHLTGNLHNPVFSGAMTAKEITINGEPVNEAGGEINLKDNILTVSNFGFRDKDGAYIADGSLNLSNDALNGKLQINDANINSLLAMGNLKNDKIYGHANGELRLTGTINSLRNTEIGNDGMIKAVQNGLLDSLDVSANMKIMDGTAAGYVIDNVDVDMALSNSILTINSFKGDEGANGRFEAKGRLNLKDKLNAEISLNDIDLAMVTGVAGIASDVGGSINTNIKCQGTLDNPMLDMSANVLKASVPGVELDKAYATLKLENNIVYIKEMVAEKTVTAGAGSATYKGNVKGTIPLDAFAADEEVCRKNSMDVYLYLDDTDLSLLPGITPHIEWAMGETDGDIHITGNRLQPLLDGKINIHGIEALIDNNIYDGAYIKVKGLDNPIEDIKLCINFDGNKAVIDEFSGKLGRGTFTANGKFVLNGTAIDDYNFDLQCDKLDISTEFYKGTADLSLNVVKATGERIWNLIQERLKEKQEQMGTEENESENKTAPMPAPPARKFDFGAMPLITGKLTLSDAIISIPTLSESETELPKVFMSFDFNIGENVRFEYGQYANLKLAGGFHIGGTTTHPFSSGAIYAKKGTFSYMKNNFKVREAILRFDQFGTLYPSVRFNADTKIGKRRVFVNIDGPLFGGAKLKFSSEPSLKEEDVIKLLAMRGDYKEGAENDWGSAASSMATVALQMALLGDVEEAVRNNMGLDLFSIEKDADGSALSSSEADTNSRHDSYNVVIGKNIGEKSSIKLSKSVNTDHYDYMYEYSFDDKISANIGRHWDRGTMIGIEANFSF